MENPNASREPDDASGRPRSVPVAIVMAAGLLTAGGVLARFGLKDVSEALSFAGRMSGFFGLVVALLMFTAAVAAFDFWGNHRIRGSGAFVLVAALLVLIINTSLLAMQIRGGEYTHWLIAWIIFVAWSIWALWMLLHRERILQEIRTPRVFAAGALLTALLPLASFGYSQIYVPYSTPMLVSVTAEFEKPIPNEATGGTALPLRLTLKNAGVVPAYVPQSIYSVNSQFEMTSEREESADDWLADADSGYPIVRRNFQVLGSTVIEAGTIFPSQSIFWLEPGDIQTIERIIQLPRDIKYQTVTASAFAILVRKDRVSLDDPETEASWNLSHKHISEAPGWVAGRGTDFIKQTFPLHEGNSLTSATRKPKYIAAWWVLQKPTKVDLSGAPYFMLTIASSESDENAEPKERDWNTFLSRYGLSIVDSGMTEIPVGALKGR
ncbi:hypothetical protein [Streptomyces sp. R35]|uniref:DUF4153 domain-containing protein n=1 Tax=Streptomyces sp. R35 TaxID=3238630 RepID=A0AB39S4I4_9ACTN